MVKGSEGQNQQQGSENLHQSQISLASLLHGDSAVNPSLFSDLKISATGKSGASGESLPISIDRSQPSDQPGVLRAVGSSFANEIVNGTDSLAKLALFAINDKAHREVFSKRTISVFNRDQTSSSDHPVIREITSSAAQVLMFIGAEAVWRKFHNEAGERAAASLLTKGFEAEGTLSAGKQMRELESVVLSSSRMAGDLAPRGWVARSLSAHEGMFGISAQRAGTFGFVSQFALGGDNNAMDSRQSWLERTKHGVEGYATFSTMTIASEGISAYMSGGLTESLETRAATRTSSQLLGRARQAGYQGFVAAAAGIPGGLAGSFTYAGLNGRLPERAELTHSLLSSAGMGLVMGGLHGAVARAPEVTARNLPELGKPTVARVYSEPADVPEPNGKPKGLVEGATDEIMEHLRRTAPQDPSAPPQEPPAPLSQLARLKLKKVEAYLAKGGDRGNRAAIRELVGNTSVDDVLTHFPSDAVSDAAAASELQPLHEPSGSPAGDGTLTAATGETEHGHQTQPETQMAPQPETQPENQVTERSVRLEQVADGIHDEALRKRFVALANADDQTLCRELITLDDLPSNDRSDAVEALDFLARSNPDLKIDLEVLRRAQRGAARHDTIVLIEQIDASRAPGSPNPDLEQMLKSIWVQRSVSEIYKDVEYAVRNELNPSADGLKDVEMARRIRLQPIIDELYPRPQVEAVSEVPPDSPPPPPELSLQQRAQVAIHARIRVVTDARMKILTDGDPNTVTPEQMAAVRDLAPTPSNLTPQQFPQFLDFLERSTHNPQDADEAVHHHLKGWTNLIESPDYRALRNEIDRDPDFAWKLQQFLEPRAELDSPVSRTHDNRPIYPSGLGTDPQSLPNVMRYNLARFEGSIGTPPEISQHVQYMRTSDPPRQEWDKRDKKVVRAKQGFNFAEDTQDLRLSLAGELPLCGPEVAKRLLEIGRYDAPALKDALQILSDGRNNSRGWKRLFATMATEANDIDSVDTVLELVVHGRDARTPVEKARYLQLVDNVAKGMMPDKVRLQRIVADTANDIINGNEPEVRDPRRPIPLDQYYLLQPAKPAVQPVAVVPAPAEVPAPSEPLAPIEPPPLLQPGDPFEVPGTSETWIVRAVRDGNYYLRTNPTQGFTTGPRQGLWESAAAKLWTRDTKPVQTPLTNWTLWEDGADKRIWTDNSTGDIFDVPKSKPTKAVARNLPDGVKKVEVNILSGDKTTTYEKTNPTVSTVTEYLIGDKKIVKRDKSTVYEYATGAAVSIKGDLITGRLANGATFVADASSGKQIVTFNYPADYPTDAPKYSNDATVAFDNDTNELRITDKTETTTYRPGGKA